MPLTMKIRNLRARIEKFHRKDEKGERLLKKRGKKKLIFSGIAVVVVIFLVFQIVFRNNGGPTLSQSDIMTLSRTDLQNTVSATGTVESANSVLVHSTETYAVESIHVKVGDYVKKGQLMATLDNENIVKQIESQEATLSDAERASSTSIAAAQHNYEQYRATLDAGLNSSILSAESSVASAYDSYERAVDKYKQYQADLASGTDSTIKSAEEQVESSYDSYIAAMNTYDRYKAELESGTNSNIMNAESALTTAYNAYTAALKTYERYKEGMNSGKNTTLLNQEASLQGAESAVNTAQDSYNSAINALSNAANDMNAAGSELQNARNRLNQAKQRTTQLATEISALNAQIASAPESGKAVLEAQRTKYQTEKTALEQEIPKYETAVSTAENRLKEAQDAYGNAQSQVNSANKGLENAKDSKNTAAALYSAAQTSVKETLEDYKTAADTAYESYLTEQTNLKAVQTAAQNTLADYATSLETAHKTFESKMADLKKAREDSKNTLNNYADDVKSAESSYKSAQSNLKSAKSSAQDQLQAYKDSLNSARAGANNSAGSVSLRQLRTDLAGTEIKAPVSGTVTAVYAKEGSSSAGLMFVIEDIDNLVVQTSVKDYDVGNISSGMPVAIKSSSTEDAVYDGEVTRIAPTANKNTTGNTDTSGDIFFATDVKVTSQKTALRIGMNVRLNFILDEAKDALIVPHAAVYENTSGQTCILAIEERQNGSQLLKEYPISIGLGNDLDTVINGDGLKEGMLLISNPSQYLDFVGQELPLAKGDF